MMDFDQEEAILQERRKRYAQALASPQNPQGQMVGRHFVAPSIFEHLASGLRQYGAMQGEKQAESDMTDLNARRQKARVDALRGFGEAMQGTPARTEAPLTPNDDEGNVNPPVQFPARPANPMAAYQGLLQSGFKDLSQLGMQGIVQTSQEQAKLALAQKERERLQGILSQAKTPQEALAAGVPVEIVKAHFDPSLGKTKLEFVNGQGVDPYTAAPQGAPIAKQAAPANLATDLLIPGPDGKLVPNSALIGAKKDIARAGKTDVNVGVTNAGPKAFEKELGELDAKQLGKYRDAAETSNSLLSTIQEMRGAEAKGAYSGGASDAKLAVANLVNGITGIELPGLVGSQQYNAEASKLVLDRVKALGANPSNADRDFIQKTVPQLSTSSTARKAMADFMEKKARESIDLYRRADAHARANHGLGGFDQFPPIAPSTATKPAPKRIRLNAQGDVIP